VRERDISGRERTTLDFFLISNLFKILKYIEREGDEKDSLNLKQSFKERETHVSSKVKESAMLSVTLQTGKFVFLPHHIKLLILFL